MSPANQSLRRVQRRVDFRRLLAAGLGEIRPAATAPADHAGKLFNDVTGVILLGEFLADRGDQVDVARRRWPAR